MPTTETLGPFDLLFLARALGTRNFEGTLHLHLQAAEGRRVRIHFLGGSPALCLSDDPLEGFAAHASSQRLVPPDVLRACAREARERGQHVEDVLKARGLMPEEAYRAARTRLSEEIFGRALGCPQAVFRLDPNTPPPADARRMRLDPWAVFFATVAAGACPEYQREYVAARSRLPLRFTPAFVPMVTRFERPFGRPGRHVVRFIRDGHSVAAMAQALGGREVVTAPLFALLFSRLVVAVGTADPIPEFSTLALLPRAPAATARAAAPPPPPAPAAPPAPPAVLDVNGPELDPALADLPEHGDPSVERLLAEHLSRLRTLDAFGALQVTPTSPLSEIREAYQRQRNRHDVEQYRAFWLGRQAHVLIQDIRRTLDEAFRVLTHPTSRPVYDRRLGRTPADVERVQQMFAAEQLFLAGVKRLQANDADGAAGALMRAVSVFPGDAVYHAFHALALARAARSPNNIPLEAREALEAALRVTPTVSLVHLIRGRLARDFPETFGGRAVAIEAYEKVLSLVPSHEEARRELRALRGVPT